MRFVKDKGNARLDEIFKSKLACGHEGKKFVITADADMST